MTITEAMKQIKILMKKVEDIRALIGKPIAEIMRGHAGIRATWERPGTS